MQGKPYVIDCVRMQCLHLFLPQHDDDLEVFPLVCHAGVGRVRGGTGRDCENATPVPEGSQGIRSEATH